VKKAQVIALALLAVLAATVGYLALRTRQPPPLPANVTHASAAVPEQCLGCHGPGGVAPRGENHPLGRDCLRCHGLPQSLVTRREDRPTAPRTAAARR
jgi:hypothetical protein